MNKKRLIRCISAFGALAFILTSAFLMNSSGKKSGTNTTITIGIPSNPYIQDINTNYFKGYLEEKTGLHLEFIVFPEEYTAEYLDRMIQSGNLTVDILFSFPKILGTRSINTVLQEYGQRGIIRPLNEYINASPVMQDLFCSFTQYNLQKLMTSSDGNMYYMPGLDTSTAKEFSQILWINQSWLKALRMEIPKTTDEFRDVLQSFHDNDPNGNGKKDEVALAGCMDSTSYQSYNLLMNSFISNDPDNSRMYVKNGTVGFAPLTHEWRNGVQYLHDLYKDGLLHDFQFSFNHQQLIQLANDPRNVLGAFTCSSITDVLLQSSPEIISNFIRVAPLAGNSGKPIASVKTPLPNANGIITSSCKNPDAAYRLLEYMMSKEAFVVGRYGEEGVDWEAVNPGDLDALGNQATIRIKKQLRNTLQNKQLLESGPFLTYKEYTDGVTWNGLQVDQEYMDARAYYLYSQYKPAEYIRTILFTYNENSLSYTRSCVDSYTNTKFEQFITGKLDPYSDAEWNEYIMQYNKLNIDKLLSAVQNSYDELQMK